MRILVVDDDSEVSDLLTRALGRDDHVVATASSTHEARNRLTQESFDLVVLDLGLPDGSGRALCQELRKQGNEAPILVLTADNSVSSRVDCLDAGADDYLAKPFAVAELRARVRALGRRRSEGRTFVYESGSLVLDFTARRALVDGREAPITAREWSILALLAGCRGRVVGQAELLEQIWGDSQESARASLEVLIARIRRKLGASLIRTVRGEGYALGE